MAAPIYATLCLIGSGLIGASIAKAATQSGAAGRVILFDQDEHVRARAKSLGLGEVASSIEAAVSQADCVILCVPVGVIGDLTRQIAPFLKPGATLSDVGSVKGAVGSHMSLNSPGNVHVIPGHPIAGTEKSGPDAGFAELFEGRWVILTPGENSDPAYQTSVNELTEFWQQLGSKVEIMDSDRHDLVLAITSHLPHLIAYNIVSTAYDMESVDEGEVVKYSAGGFRDFTRIAASDPTMWRDVFLNNRDAVLETLGRFTEDLTALQRAIRIGDGERLFAEVERARGIRTAILEAGEDADRVNFGRNEPDE